jgi:hypothetical protein
MCFVRSQIQVSWKSKRIRRCERNNEVSYFIGACTPDPDECMTCTTLDYCYWCLDGCYDQSSASEEYCQSGYPVE